MIFLKKYKIQGHSMEPTLINGSEVLVSSIPYLLTEPNASDIVLFQKDNEGFIKRIKKKKGKKYFLLGDNKKDSLDSHSLGWVDKKDIIGKVVYKL